MEPFPERPRRQVEASLVKNADGARLEASASPRLARELYNADGTLRSPPPLLFPLPLPVLYCTLRSHPPLLFPLPLALLYSLSPPPPVLKRRARRRCTASAAPPSARRPTTVEPAPPSLLFFLPFSLV